MVTECYKEFVDSGREKKLREWIDSGNMSPKLQTLMVELITIIDCQQAVIKTDDELFTREYQEACR